MNEMHKAYYNMVEIIEQEAKKLYRLRWRAKAHGCSEELEMAILKEAQLLDRYARSAPDRILERYLMYKFKFAFKI